MGYTYTIGVDKNEIYQKRNNRHCTHCNFSNKSDYKFYSVHRLHIMDCSNPMRTADFQGMWRRID